MGDANSPIIEELIFLHDFINIILMFIIRFVGYIIIRIIYNSYINIRLSERSHIEFNAYIIPTNELELSMFRLLDVDNRTLAPFNIHVRMLIRSADVLHA